MAGLRLAGALAALGALASGSPAHAEAPPPTSTPAAAVAPRGAHEPMIGVLRIDASGVSDTAEARFEQGVAEGLTGAGWRVMDRTSVQKALAASTEYIEACGFGPCLRAVHDATGIETVLVARIEGIGRTYSFVVSLMDTRTGLLVSQVAQNCSVCTVEDAITTATLSAVELVLGVDEARAPRSGPVAPAPAAPPDRHLATGRTLRRVGWTGVALGAAALAGGAIVWSRDREWAVGLGGGGLALAASGALMIGFGASID